MPSFPLATVPVPDSPEPAEGWRRLEGCLAFVAVIAFALRITLPVGLTTGYIFALLLLPLWIRTPRKYSSVLLLFGGIGLAIASGVFLTYLSAPSHRTSTTAIVSNSMLLVGLAVGIGVVLWARTLMHEYQVVLAFGIGMLMGASSDSELYASNPWRFGYSLAVTLILLGLAQYFHRRWLELGVILALAGVASVTDARSSFAMLLLTAALVAWQMRPKRDATQRGSAVRILLAIGLLAVVVYNLGQAVILDGLLGEETQQRTLEQIDASGSLILGGRPEIAATAALMNENPAGFGSGTLPTVHDVTTAKEGMFAIGYDPDNGYVERYMFGNGFTLHSVLGDLWVSFGIAGLALGLGILVLTLKRLGELIASTAASAIVIYLGIRTLWNLFFSPLYSSVPFLVLFLGLAVAVTTTAVTTTAVTTTLATTDTPTADTGRTSW